MLINWNLICRNREWIRVLLDIHPEECSSSCVTKLLKCQEGRCVSLGLNSSLIRIPAVDGKQTNNGDITQICIIQPASRIQIWGWDVEIVRPEDRGNEPLLPNLLEITQSEVWDSVTKQQIWKLWIKVWRPRKMKTLSEDTGSNGKAMV